MSSHDRVTTPSGAPFRSAQGDATREPSGRVVLFSGHMIDAPGRTSPRFPPEMVPEATIAIRDALSAWNIGAGDLGICGGACGGDLIFAEACLQIGARVELLLPFPVPEFVERSVAFAGDSWVRRFHAVSDDPRTTLLVMADGTTIPADDESAYTRHAHWQLDHALSRGPKEIWFLCLWDGATGDGPGGTSDMIAAIEARHGRITVIDSARLLAERRVP